MLWKFSEKLYTQAGIMGQKRRSRWTVYRLRCSRAFTEILKKDEKLLAQLEVHMEIVVVAFAFILEDFAELFVEYFCVEKYITGYDYEKETAQSFTAAVSSITLNLIGKVFSVSWNIESRYPSTAYLGPTGSGARIPDREGGA